MRKRKVQNKEVSLYPGTEKRKTILDQILTGILMTTVTVLLSAVFSLILSMPTYFLWNWLVPSIFGIREITILESWGISFLAGISFKNNININYNK